MRWIAGLLLLLGMTGLLRAEVIDLREAGRLEIIAAGDWKIAGEDQGDRFVVTITPNGKVNAGARLVVSVTPADDLPDPGRLRHRVHALCLPFAEKSVERKVTLEKFYRKEGFGFHATFTDPELVGRPPAPGQCKIATYGVVRLAPRVYVAITLLADGVMETGYQALLGAVEGMELRPARR